jgi:hypothetical protein
VETPVDLNCLGAEKVRGNWLTFPVVLETKAPQEEAMAAAAAAPAPAAAAPAAAAVPVPAPAPVPAAAPATAAQGVKDQAFFEQQQQRLRSLKRMHDDGLITDAEFDKKRQEIIDGL